MEYTSPTLPHLRSHRTLYVSIVWHAKLKYIFMLDSKMLLNLDNASRIHNIIQCEGSMIILKDVSCQCIPCLALWGNCSCRLEQVNWYLIF